MINRYGTIFAHALCRVLNLHDTRRIYPGGNNSPFLTIGERRTQEGAWRARSVLHLSRDMYFKIFRSLSPREVILSVDSRNLRKRNIKLLVETDRVGGSRL